MAYTTDREGTTDRARERPSKGWAVFAVVALAALAVMIFWGIRDDEDMSDMAAQTSPQTASVEGIAADPAAYVGQSVTVRGGVAEVASERTFRLRGDDARFAESVAVLEDPDASAELREDAWVEVSGIVRMFDERAIESDLSIEIDDARARALEGEAVVVATTVSVLDDARARVGE